MSARTLLPPALLALASLIGLILTLVANGIWDWVGLACLAPALLVAVRTMVLTFDRSKDKSSPS